jgi:hypothetical protein
LNRTLALEELEKRTAKEARRARYKRDGGQRRVASEYEYGVIKAEDTRLRIAGREQYTEQKRAERAQRSLKGSISFESRSGEKYQGLQLGRDVIGNLGILLF